MKFIDDVQIKLTGKRACLDIPLTSITEQINTEPSYMAVSEKVEYEIKLIWGYKAFCPPKEIERSKDTAIRMLKHQLYGELKGDLLELQRDAFDSDWETVRNKVELILNKLDM